MRKSRVLTFVLIFMLFTSIAASGADYPDVKSSNWAYEAVSAMSEKAIIQGYLNGSFQPGKTVTYGEFIKMALIAGTGQDVGNAAPGSEHWAMNYYNKALELKYFTSHDIDKSQLKYEITRGDMALIISSILGDVKIENYDEIQKGIKDITYQTKHEYDITKAYATGILTGYTDKTFRPEKTLTRAESATVIYRLVDESKRVLPGGEKEEVTTTAVVTIGKTADLIKNYKTFYAEADAKAIAEGWDYLPSDGVRFTEEYELYTDASVWDIKMNRLFNGESCSFVHTLRGHIYLVKDGLIVNSCNTSPRFDGDGNYLNYQGSRAEYDISKVDYIIAVPTSAKSDKDEIIKVVANPFKK
ncbi:S-layer homology domain-containing protein [Sinanaerobacter chloroacetimidivorans]|uniref:S-layer homology domain-containing protein n=1 Tax=Sinanaerobacter chloroacetimidivorans TaxID=2818044 RepID=A0A8J8B2Y1_9FIRM|nr:S-layer homology domain-containing protein [Sinanaerobacter chloroacetimidivorans]MBR0599201.1 S-layer homology domain-containing protein [Sinanaerobacter chloroacetimidivorans]